MTRATRSSTATATLFMVICASYFLVPLWWLLVASSKDQAALSSGKGLWFSDPFLLFDNITDVVTYDDGIFVRWAFNSLVYAGVGAVLGTLFAAMAGYALAKYVFPGREATFNVILGGVLVPATALALPLFLLFSEVDQADTMWAILLPSLVSPFGVYLARIFAASAVPDELLEAARIDGASEFRTFFTVAIRLMGPALVTIFLFQFVAIWNNFFLPLVMLQDTTLYPLTLGLNTWNSQVNQLPELRLFVIVGSLLSIVPLVIAFLALQRFWRSGLAEGGVKA
ncbi:carbohydrate ABC transporter permease [Mumia zhuanghuii]|uniref:Carbohydrate ABC transporter permease n=2 Tax=Mumia TaxID=1546255 RepID=A0ABW1QI70_9ACTN|nr:MULTISPECIES: carbohydrate ABC transporter permease [Mumia]KAA1418238.1 carbohydrate ABC transporter permease [Mumia zhuanghuii]